MINTTKPYIDFEDDDVPPNLIAIATNISGECRAFNAVPKICEDRGFWHINDANGRQLACSANYFKSFRPGTCDWKDSLVVRPGHEDETK